MVGVAVIAGSVSDRQIVDMAVSVLKEAGVSYDCRVISAHRDPDILDSYIKNSDAEVFICIAGLSAALPGVVASKTKKPVIGVPVSGSLGGIDSLLSIAQMPDGVPVACVGINNGANGAYMALRILALKN